jgi:hypothetical protein
MLKQHGPKVEAGLEVGLGMLKQQRPRVDAGLDAGRRVIALHAPKVRSFAGQAGRRIDQLRGYAMANPRRFGRMAAASVLATVALYYSAHFALYHRSRCPSVAASSASANSSGGSNAPSRSFSLMVDAAGSIRQSGNAQVYYDVCGLEKGTSFMTRVTISRNESALGRLFGRSAGPVTDKFEETADGPRIRRHRTLDMDGMPGGSYWINVVVTDQQGRRREEGTNLRVRGGE